MAKRDTPAGDRPALRERAEERLRHRTAKTPLPEGDARRLVHDLEVHQIELEIQNEELRSTRLEAETQAARYAELYEFAPMGYATLGGDGTVRAINLAGASLLGIERTRLVGQPLERFVSPEDRSAFRGLLAETLTSADQTHSTLEIALTHPERRIHARLVAAPLPRGQSEILLAIEDVSDRKRRERELEETLRILHVSQRVAKVGTFVMEIASGKWTSSPVLDEILGVDARFRRTSDGWRSLVHPDDRDEMLAHLRSAIREEHRLDWEYRIIRRATSDVRSVAIVGEVEHDGIEPVRLVGTIQDVTERKRLLQERAELLRIAEEARGRAEGANRAKDAFLATLSHELRNPLAPISNSLFILEQAEPGSEQALRATEVIHRQVSHMARLVNDLLDVTRITRGKIHLERRRVDLNELARSVLEDHRTLFDRNGVRLELAAAPEPLHVDADRDRVAQVLGNLLQNAAKFSHRGGTTRVTVSHEERVKRAIVRVADTGIGMAPEMLARLFQPFMQADTTLDRREGGLGLGMALAKALVELHGGEIRAQSDGLGRGSEFEVRLPLAKAEAAKAGAARPRAPRAPRRVLVIEDNADAADSMRELLQLHGHEVEVAYSGPDGLAKARDFRPEVVICDIGLPGMDGCEVAREIRGDRTLKDTYLIALSGYALQDDLRRAEESGFHRHVAKPADPELLERLFAEAFTRAPSA